ncbi:hypothetical protein Tco_0730749 [Tanacetum coccineum]
MESNKSIDRSDQQKKLYKALVDAYAADKDLLDAYGDTVTIKRQQDELMDTPLEQTGGPREGVQEKNQNPPVHQKRRHPKEPIHTEDDFEEPTHQEFETGVNDDQPEDEIHPYPDWFQKPTRLPSPDRDWNKTLPADHGPVQPWLSNLARQEDPRESFDELMDTPLDFSAFVMNRLKVDTLTLELLAGLTFELEYIFKEVYKATTEQLDWTNPDGQQYPHDLRKPLPLISNTRGKLSNLKIEERLAFSVALRMFTRSIVIQRRVEDFQLAYSSPRGFIYHNKDKKNRLMRLDELHKFSDGTLNDVRTALDDRLKGIRMEYLPKTIWRQSDKERATAMIQAIDKRLKSKRIMSSPERFVGGRPYEGDLRLLQRII